MIANPAELHDAWLALRANEKGLHALDIAERLGVGECELLATACGIEGDIVATRLEADWATFIAKLPKLGHVKTVTRNPNAVIEVFGTYDAIEFFGAMGQSVSSIDLRFFVQRWKYAFAVSEQTKRGLSRGIQFFDAAGRAVHKLYLRDESDSGFFDRLIVEHTSSDTARTQAVEPAAPPPPVKPHTEIDVAGMRAAWLAMKDTHEFFGLLRKFSVARTQALALVGDDLAYRVAPSALESILDHASKTDLNIMVFVGNPGVIQIYSGTVKKIHTSGDWVNVLDPAFNLHVRRDRIASAWVVRKPTVDGHVTSLELYSGDGEQIALLVGKRKPGQKENDAWRSAIASLSA